MKKFIFIILGILIHINCNSQQLQKDIKIDSKTLISGGEYILIPSILGKSIVLKEVRMRYNPNTIIYTINSTDSIKIVTDSPNTELDYLIVLSDSIFIRTTPYISVTYGDGDYNFSNSIRINIPTGKFTIGNGDLYFTFKYDIY
jgi:hypothetical protein